MKRRRIADLRSESGREHEEGLVNFIDPAYKARFREVLKKVAARRPPGNAGGRGRYQLNHFAWWDDRFATDVSLNQSALEARLRAAGAPATCWVISEDSEIDAAELPVAEALARMWESWEATIASCIPGRLAYYHDNDERSHLILQRG